MTSQLSLLGGLKAMPNPSLQPTCYGWLRQPSQAAEFKRWACIRNCRPILVLSGHLTVLAALLALAGCSPKSLDKLKIQFWEGGPVSASSVPNAPSQEGVVAYTREGMWEKAVYRKRLPCPMRMVNSITSAEVLPDRIVLCFEPIESNDPVAAPLSACPYDLVIRYEMSGIPASIEPKFEVRGTCPKGRQSP